MQFSEWGNSIFQHNALLTIREMVMKGNLPFIEANLIAPMRNETLGSCAIPFSITQSCRGNVGENVGGLNHCLSGTQMMLS
jgi:hypothetical protein